MSKAGELYALAERCEQAMGLDRELGAAIVVALDLRPDWVNKAGELWIDPASLDEPVIRWNTLGKRSQGNPPIGSYAAYTASLDAAMSLVPEGWRLRQMNFSAPCADERKWHLNLYGGREGGDTFVGRARSPALALCAAALRARAAQEAGR